MEILIPYLDTLLLHNHNNVFPNYRIDNAEDILQNELGELV